VIASGAPKRVVLVTTSYPRAPDDGSGHFVASEARALAQRGHEVHVIAAGRGQLADGGLTIHWVGGGALFGWPGAASRIRERPWRLIHAAPFALAVERHLVRLSQRGITEAIAHWLVPSAWPLLVRHRLRLTAVAHGADVRLLLGLPARVRRHVVSKLVAHGTRFRFVAHTLRDDLCRSLPPGLARSVERTSSIEPCPIDVPHGDPARREALRARLGCRPSDRMALALGRLVATKRVDLAIAAVTRLGPGWVLAVVGDGPERAPLERLSRSSGVRASFTGQLPRDEALALLAASDVLVHTAASEGAPTAIREARALGVKVVSTGAGDVGRWAATDRGIVVSAANAASLAQAVAGLGGSAGAGSLPLRARSRP
jgi:glycosyltransferase involved in cell wall biosynthesis